MSTLGTVINVLVEPSRGSTNLTPWVTAVFCCRYRPPSDLAPDPAAPDLQRLVVGGCDSRALGAQPNQ